MSKRPSLGTSVGDCLIAARVEWSLRLASLVILFVLLANTFGKTAIPKN